MESSAQTAGAAGEQAAQATQEMPPVSADASPGVSPIDAHAAAGHDTFAERPEIFVGAAFAGGLVLARILKRLGR